MSTISAVDDPLTYLQPPVGSGTGSSIWQLRLKCGLLIGAADAVVSAFTGWSPLERWVFEPFAGDWDAFDRAGAAWRNGGKSIGAVAANINALPGQVGDSWNGQAMDAWADLQTKITDAIGSLPEACDAMGEFAEALADMARAIVDLIAEILGIIGDTVTRILLEQAFPVVGQIVGAGEMVIVAGRVVRFHGVIIIQLRNFYTQAQKIERVIKIIEEVMVLLEKVHAALEATGSAVSASNRATVATAKTA
jgi:hypothetical protein